MKQQAIGFLMSGGGFIGLAVVFYMIGPAELTYRALAVGTGLCGCILIVLGVVVDRAK